MEEIAAQNDNMTCRQCFVRAHGCMREKTKNLAQRKLKLKAKCEYCLKGIFGQRIQRQAHLCTTHALAETFRVWRRFFPSFPETWLIPVSLR